MNPRVGSLCTGYGGLDHAAREVLGGHVIWHADNDPDASRLLAYHWPDIPNLGDITTVDWATVEPVDVLCAGFPCQSVSVAGKRAGITAGAASGLWVHVAAAIDALRPALVVIENVGGLRSAKADSNVEPCPGCLGDPAEQRHMRALGAVLADLATLGMDARWTSLRASAVGAPHQRERVFIIAWPAGDPDGVAGPAGRTLGRRPGQVDEPGSQQRLVGPDRLPVPDTEGFRLQRSGTAWDRRSGPADADIPVADTAGDRHGHTGQGSGQRVQPATVPSSVDWGVYAPAVTRWERITGWPVPDPNEPAPKGGRRLSPAFVEWMMGLDPGHVTGVPDIRRNAQLRLLGNGVVPRQAAAALRLLLTDPE